MISVTILVKNGERCIKEVLNSLSLFDDVILYDTGSTDRTLEIASAFQKVRIFQRPFNGFGASHNAAAAEAKHDWVLSVDSDEVLSAELAQEILSLKLEPKCVYSIPFVNFYRRKEIKWCGWQKKRHLRLYNRQTTSFSEALVHEAIQIEGLKQVPLTYPAYHYPYATVSDFLVKMERYSTLFAEQYRGKRASSPLIALGHGLFTFFKSYFLKKGFLGGYEGFLISAYNAHTALYKYLKLYEANRKKQP